MTDSPPPRLPAALLLTLLPKHNINITSLYFLPTFYQLR